MNNINLPKQDAQPLLATGVYPAAEITEVSLETQGLIQGLGGTLSASNKGTITLTIASPCVVSLNSHGFSTGNTVILCTTGALPTGLTNLGGYFVIYKDGNSFWLATTYVNAIAGTKITTTGSQSGTHSLYFNQTASLLNTQLALLAPLANPTFTGTASFSGATVTGITATEVGLSNVTNDAQVKRTEMGVANGVTTNGSDGKVNASQLPTTTTYPSNFITGLVITNTTTAITIKAGLQVNVNGTLYTLGSDATPSLTTITGYLSGSTGFCWCAVCVNETTPAISVQVLGVGTSAITASNTLGVPIGTTKDLENQLNLYSIYNNNLGYCRSRINGAGDYYRIIAIFKYTVSFTDASFTYASGEYRFTCTSNAKYSIGQLISGSNIPANAEIVEVSGTTAGRLNVIPTGSATITIANSITEIIPILDRPKSYVKMYNNIVQTGISSGINVLNLVALEIDVNSEISGVYTARFFTASIQKKVQYKCEANLQPGSGGTTYLWLLKNSNIYKEKIINHASTSYNSDGFNESFQLFTNNTLQFAGLSYNGCNVDNFVRQTSVIIEEI